MRQFKRVGGFFVLALSGGLLFMQACKTARTNSGNADSSLNANLHSISGNGQQMEVSVPSFVKDYKGSSGASSSSTHKTVSLGLAATNITATGGGTPTGTTNAGGTTNSTAPVDRPSTNANGTSMNMQCYNRDNALLGNGTFFYAELQVNGQPILTAWEANIRGCDSMQLTITQLQVDQTYTVYASIYWESDDGTQQVVLYDGQTQPFKPTDQETELVLKKKVMDQVINIDLQKDAKDKCITSHYAWDGQNCINTPNALVFTFNDGSDYGQNPTTDATSRQRSCLTVDTGSKTKAYQYTCNFNEKQMFTAVLYGTKPQNFPDSKTYNPLQSFFEIQLSSGSKTKQCLTFDFNDYLNGSARFPYLYAAPCFDTSGDTPYKDGQIFVIYKSSSGDLGGRDSYMIQAVTSSTNPKLQNLCVSLPPIPGDPIPVSPNSNNVSVYLTPCQNPATVIQRTQFLRFEQADY